MTDARSTGGFARLVLTPLRLATGWGRPHQRIGFLAALFLILLRLCVGYHFFSEGVDKLSGDFDAGRFFATARGPFAEHFQNQIWDWNGKVRLDRDRTVTFWKGFRGRAIKKYSLDEASQKAIDQSIARGTVQLDAIFVSYANEIQEFELGRERLAKLNNDATRDGVSSLGGQRDTIRQEWRKLIAPVLTQIDQVWANIERDVERVVPASKRAFAPISMGRPRDVMIDTSVINPILPYFDLAIGMCLIMGLFTPVAALIAAGFLGSVFASQFPPTAGPGSTYYHMVEAAACLVLAGTGAGRFAGLDFLFYALGIRLWRDKPEQ
jgi:uncharacterized membrane protein YphA (DoxX/SURF4 family)